MGVTTIRELFSEAQKILDKRSQLWNGSNTLMIDVLFKRERHILFQSFQQDDEMPSMRDFGPQDRDELMNQAQSEKLDKILPVLNGLLYVKKGKI